MKRVSEAELLSARFSQLATLSYNISFFNGNNV